MRLLVLLNALWVYDSSSDEVGDGSESEVVSSFTFGAVCANLRRDLVLVVELPFKAEEGEREFKTFLGSRDMREERIVKLLGLNKNYD